MNEEDYGQIILKHAMIPNLVCYGTMSCGIKSTRKKITFNYMTALLRGQKFT